ETDAAPTLFTFQSTGTATITDGTINAQLSNANVLVKTGAGGTGNGDITFDTAGGAIDLTPDTGTPANNLTFDAHGSIFFAGGDTTSVSLNGGQLTLRAQSGSITQDTAADTLALTNTPLLMSAATGIGTSTSSPFVTTGMADVAANTASGGIFLSNSGSDVNI